jgi:hypothetical protein
MTFYDIDLAKVFVEFELHAFYSVIGTRMNRSRAASDP